MDCYPVPVRDVVLTVERLDTVSYFGKKSEIKSDFHPGMKIYNKILVTCDKEIKLLNKIMCYI